jgi:hypothetical protein
LTEVVLAKNIAGTTATAESRRYTDVSKAVIQIATKGNSQIDTANQTRGTLQVGVTIALALGAGTTLVTKIRTTLSVAGTTATGSALFASICRLITGLTIGTGITTVTTGAIGTGIRPVAEEPIVAGSRVVCIDTDTRAADVGRTNVAIITVIIDRTNTVRIAGVVRLVTGLTSRTRIAGMGRAAAAGASVAAIAVEAVVTS